jgi:hypothetical protein
MGAWSWCNRLERCVLSPRTSGAPASTALPAFCKPNGGRREESRETEPESLPKGGRELLIY